MEPKAILGLANNQVNTILGIEETPVDCTKTIRFDPTVLGKSLPQTGVTIERKIAFIPGVTEKTICSRIDFTGFKGKEEALDVNFFDDDQ